MSKVAIVILADSETAEGRGRMVHALQLAQALKEANDDFTLVFEGIGVRWLAAFHQRDHPFTQNYGPVFDAVRSNILGACDFCSRTRFEVGDALEAAGHTFLGGDGHHFNMHELVEDQFQIITF